MVAIYFIAAWILVVVTHGLTRGYMTKPIVNEVTEVRYIERQVHGVFDYFDEFVIDETYQMRSGMPLEIIIDREIRKSKERLFNSIPTELFTFMKTDSFNPRYEKKYTTILRIAEPKK